MQRTGQNDTAPEIALRRVLFARGLRYRKNARPTDKLRTRADIVFTKARVAVYVDGCFWHGCSEHATWPRKNKKFWAEKIEANIARDRKTDEALSNLGWTVVRVWEHEDPERAAYTIESLVRAAVRHP